VQLSELVRLRVLDVCGCEGVTSASLPLLAPLTALTHLNMEQCPGLKGDKLHHIAGRWVEEGRAGGGGGAFWGGGGKPRLGHAKGLVGLVVDAVLCWYALCLWERV
jgi:hypothetical protein